MNENVRFVSDGEELVTQQAASLPRAGAESHRPPAPAAARLAVQYRGFRDAEGRRDYLLSAQGQGEARLFTLTIPLAAFAERRALLQDGPAICYQKLVALLAVGAPEDDDAIRVSDAELAEYSTAHAAPVRRTFTSLPPPRPAATSPPETVVGDAPARAGAAAR